MNQKWIALLLAVVMVLSLAACGTKEETTVTGMVVAVNGTKISLMEMDLTGMSGQDFSKGERPEMPEGMEGFEGFGDFNPEDFDGQMPEGFGGSMPEGENFPQWGEGEMPEMPEGMTPPEGMPEGGKMPDFSGESGGMRPGFGNFGEGMETKEVDIANAHISVEIDEGKESGSLENIQVGTFVTITINGKGEATYVLVSARSGFGGGFRPGSNG